MTKKKINTHEETSPDDKNTDVTHIMGIEFTDNGPITDAINAPEDTSDENTCVERNTGLIDESTKPDEDLGAEVINISYTVSVIEEGVASESESVIDEYTVTDKEPVVKDNAATGEEQGTEDRTASDEVSDDREETVSDEISDIEESTISDEASDIEESIFYDEVSDIEESIISDDTSDIENSTVSDEVSDINAEVLKKKKRRKYLIRTLRILFTIGFFVFAALFLDEVLIQPYKMNRSIEKAQDLYQDEVSRPVIHEDITIAGDEADEAVIADSVSDTIDYVTPAPTPDPNRDEMGRLKKFTNLLEVNEDVKGWIRLDNINGENDTKINYVVVQSDPADPEYYLERTWDTHEYLKAGSIFLDVSSSVEKGSKNLIIHGHNMTSSDDMFHYLLEYNDLDFLKEHPVINFDTIYEEALWKVFSVYITPGNNDRDDFFPFVKASFASDREFMEYIYDIRVRSLFNMDDIDINENDQILTLSTCSYELPNYRTIIVARKVRAGEEPTVNTENFEKKDPKDVLFAPSYYWRYGGKAPKIPSFDEALADGLIPWYKPVNP